MDPTTVLVVTDTNSAARPADRGTPRPEDMGYRTFLRAFKLRDLVDLHPVLQGTYSCFQGAARSRIDTVACHSDAQFTIALYHHWGSTLLSDHHVSLLFTAAFPVVQLDKPSPPYGIPHAGIPPGPSGPVPGGDRRFPKLGAPQEGLQPPGRPAQVAEVPAAGHL